MIGSQEEVERGSTFTRASDLSRTASILFNARTHVKITRHWKSTLRGKSRKRA